jgi:hypothetical protein
MSSPGSHSDSGDERSLSSTKEKSPDVSPCGSHCALVSSSPSVLIRLEVGHNKNINC